MGGVTAYHLRMLVENPWNGGAGYTWKQVGEMTLDQIWGRLCDIELLKRDIGQRMRVVATDMSLAELRPDNAGLYTGRSADGTVIKGKIGGKSRARQLMEEAAKRKEEERVAKRKKRRGS